MSETAFNKPEWFDVEMADYYRIMNEGKNSTTFPV
jgi:hypothetical protein